MPHLALVKSRRKPQPGDQKVVKGIRYIYSDRARKYLLVSVGTIEVKRALALVMEKPPSVVQMMNWTFQDRWRAIWWAGREHLKASDNVLPSVPVPRVLLPFLHPVTRKLVKVWDAA